jgi:hypothetical protein
MNTPPLFAAVGMFAFGPGLIVLAIWVVIIVAMWKVFEKGGQPGWGCIIPIYNLYCLMMIAGKPWWWLLLLFIPIVNIVIAILVAIAIAENFGKGGAFAVGLIFLPFIFYPILGFGDATYRGAAPPAATA